MADGQLPLAFPHRPALSAADFLPHSGVQLALDFLERPETWPDHRLVLYGGAGAGKTHLLHLWASERGASIVAGAKLRAPFWPESAVAVDDADQAPDEVALLHLLNAAAEAGRPVLLTGSRPLGRVAFRLPDLASRLRATTAVEIGPAGEEFLASLLAKLLSERQLSVSAAVQTWLLQRLPRSPAALRKAVARLDYAALAAKSGVTRALAADALAALASDELVQETSHDPCECRPD